MKTHDVSQGSLEWLSLRAGVPTASEFDCLVTPEFKIRTGEMPKTYLAKKLAEWWQGGPLLEYNTFDMEQGVFLEESAKPHFTIETGREITNVGFVTTDDGLIGCSPDGLLEPDSGVEIKCPRIETHVRYLLAGGVPKDYLAQVHGSMFVTNRKTWNFYSFRRHLPPLLVAVDWDEKIQSTIGEALDVFLESFTEGKKRLCEINGGPPKRITVPKKQPSPEPGFDVMP
jgi:hypothetical protein